MVGILISTKLPVWKKINLHMPMGSIKVSGTLNHYHLQKEMKPTLKLQIKQILMELF